MMVWMMVDASMRVLLRCSSRIEAYWELTATAPMPTNPRNRTAPVMLNTLLVNFIGSGSPWLACLRRPFGLVEHFHDVDRLAH